MKKINLLLATFLLSSCSFYNLTSQDISENYYPPKQSINDVTYLEKIDQPNEVIGYVTASAERNKTMDQVLEKLKREAAGLGADAITDIREEAPGYWKKLPAQKLVGNGYVRANFIATAVKFKSSEQPQQ